MKTSRRVLVVSLLAAGLSLTPACKTTPENEKPGNTANTPSKPKKIVTTMPDQSSDVAFQAFLSRLRQAVAAKDAEAIAGMMTPDFGYGFGPNEVGEGVFAYWDQHNVWPELQLVIGERFVPFGDRSAGFMVAPAEFTTAENYAGYRAGIQLVHGSWKFAYFVSGTAPEGQ